MESSSNESRLILALKALKNNHNLSVWAAAIIYNIPRTTLRDRRAGCNSRRNIIPPLKNMTETEEQVILRRVLKLDSRGFQCQLEDV